MKTEQDLYDPEGIDPEGLELDVFLYQLNAELYRTTLDELGGDIKMLHLYELQSERCGCHQCKALFLNKLQACTEKWDDLIPELPGKKSATFVQSQSENLPKPPLVYS